MKEMISVKKFAEESPELFKAFKDYADNVMAVERDMKGKSFSNVSLDDKEKVINKLFAEDIARRSKVTVEDYGDMMHYSRDPRVKAFADTNVDHMIDMILPDALNSSVGLIAEIDYVDWGDVAEFELENNALFNVSKAGHRQKNATFQQLENQTVTVPTEPRQVSVMCTLFDILTNRKSIARYVMKAVKSIEIDMANEAWDAFATAVGGATVPNKLKVGNYTQESAVTLADTVTAYNGGAKAVFAGTPLALSNILPTDANYRYTLDDAMVRLGYVPQFMTYDVMPTPNFADYKKGDYSLKLPNDKIYVVSPASDKVIKIAVGKALTTQSGRDENANRAETITIGKDYGIMAVTNSIAGVITV